MENSQHHRPPPPPPPPHHHHQYPQRTLSPSNSRDMHMSSNTVPVYRHGRKFYVSAEEFERMRAEEAVRTLAAKLSDAEDAERRIVAQDIHDALGQTLSVVKLNLVQTNHQKHHVKKIIMTTIAQSARNVHYLSGAYGLRLDSHIIDRI